MLTDECRVRAHDPRRQPSPWLGTLEVWGLHVCPLFIGLGIFTRLFMALEFLCFTHIFIVCETNHNNHFILFCYATAMVGCPSPPPAPQSPP